MSAHQIAGIALAVLVAAVVWILWRILSAPDHTYKRDDDRWDL